MANKTLTVKVKTDVSGADKVAGLGTTFRNVGRNLSVGVTLPVLAAGGALIDLARDAEETDAKLASVFDSMSANSWTSIDALHEHADALAAATTFDDDQVKDAQAMLLTFGNVTGDTFTAATDAAADLAVFFETDMEDAALTLGKALQDPVDGLSRLGRQGIIFSDEQAELVRNFTEAGDLASAQAIILGEVERQVGNVAEDLAATNSGQTAQDMNRLGEAGEKIGTLLLPVLSTLADILGNVADFINDLSPEQSQLIITIVALAAAVGPVLVVLGSLIGAFGAVGTAFGFLGTLLLANPFVALIAAIVALVALIILNWDNIVKSFENLYADIERIVGDIATFVGDAWDGIVKTFTDAVETVKGIGAKIFTPIGKGFAAAIGVIKGVWNTFARWWNGIAISVPAVDVPFVGRVGGFSIGLPDLPTFAEGGIVNRPTLGIFGEKGPEAIVPLDDFDRGPSEIHYHTHLTVQGDLQARNVAQVEDALLRVSRFTAVGGASA